MIHLDTHVVLWLYQRDLERFPAAVLRRLGSSRPLVSPIVRLELALLREIGRITVSATEILDSLRQAADLGVAESSFDRATALAAHLPWTRDPFDRLIAAHALADDLPLLTRDATVLANCPVACWE